MEQMVKLGSGILIGALYTYWPFDFEDLDKEGLWSRSVESMKILGDRAGSVKVFDDRLPCSEYLKTAVKRGDVVIIAGARDESLSIWAKSMTKYA